MDVIKSFSTPVNYLVDLDGLGLVEGAKAQLRRMNLAELLLISDGFNNSSNLNQVGEIRLKKLEEEISNTEEYKIIKKYI